MGLGDITKKLYAKKDKLKDRKPTEDTYDSTKLEQLKDEFEKHEKEIVEELGTDEPSEKEIKKTNRKLFAFGGTVVAVLVAMVLLVFVYYKFIGSAFSEDKILIEIEGPEEVRSAEEAIYTIRVKNNNRVSLRDSKFNLNYPDDMVIEEKDFLQQQGFNNAKIDIGEVKARGNKEYKVGFEPFGPRDKQVYLNASLTYQPSNFSSDFEKSVQKSIMIKSSPISVAIIPTQEAASGDSIEIDVIIKNESTNNYSNLELRMDYSDGFVFIDSDQLPLRDNRVWGVGTLGSKEQKRIKISGSVEGLADSLKNFKSVVGQTRDDDKFLVYTEIEGSTRIIASRVELIQDIARINKVYAGTDVEYVIRFKNTSDVPLRDLILTQNISSGVLDLESFIINDGYYNSSDEVITWKAAQVPALKLLQSQESGEVKFRVTVKKTFPMNNENDKNFSIVSYAELESLDVNSPIWQNKKIRSAQRVVKINSKLILNVSFAYNDGEIPNSGPVPLIVRKKTTLTGRLNVLNTSNDLKNVIVKTSLAPGVSWEDNFIPRDPGVQFNSRTNELKWIIGTIDAGVGFISPVKTIAFQVGVTPSENQAKKSMIVLDEVVVNALDTYTGNPVEYTFNKFFLVQSDDVPSVVEISQ
ncbi:MAG: hypothetical protein U9O20_02895 [Patescibacteria group bacterium]|nr:hypothetical protein [Patescibacteria group bacterium]